ncbi:hypothetical protein GGQ80_003072 [Sphingomonas jinjuensis]|jgi:hypothetical protein|uniref:DUF3035 domain-containing protein n=1 Tax=Sphingomonas jinjuensis TaxID=535907 RepID=A0A840FPE8_9SPHN|nr:DUF3035 domain-containing protein [Sphingomonas jinjuensis]MBB4155155.1 hypothetical protein [Sphingomonas jinjuensis]
MRKSVSLVAAVAVAALALSGCARGGINRVRPDEFAVARQAPLVIPPDFALVPPQPGAAATNPQTANAQAETLQALFGGPARRSASESATIDEAGATSDEAGIRSSVGDPSTTVVDKGSTTRDIVAAPQGDGQDARAKAGN